jgi:hypothetical protein
MIKFRSHISGGVLVLFAFALVAIIGALALFFESGKSATNIEQARNYMRLMSLAMLEGFMGSAGTYQERYEAGVDRIRKIADGNQYLLALKGDTSAGVRASQIGDGGSVNVIPGSWSCQAGETGEACFDELASPDDNNLPNAFKVSGTLFTSRSGLLGRRIFGGVTESGGAGLTSIATVVPRQICFAVDLSSSMVRENHRYWFSLQADPSGGGTQCINAPTDPRDIDFGAGLGGEFAYFLANPGTPFNPGATPATSHQCSANYFFNPAANAPWVANRVQAINGRPGLPPVPPVTSIPLPSDYILRLIYDDSDYQDIATAINNGGFKYGTADKYIYNPDPAAPGGNPAFSITATNQYYSVNYFRGARSELLADGTTRVDQFEGPQPLGVVMSGIRDAIIDLRNRRVAGDKACLIFFDSRLEWPRIVKLTDDFNFLDRYVASFNNLAPNLGLGDGDPTNDIVNDSIVPGTVRGAGNFYPNFQDAAAWATSGFDFLIRMGIFPKQGRQSDYLGAVRLAMNILVAERATTNLEAQTSIVVIGDWVHNCLSVARSNPDGSQEQSGCNNTFNRFRAASEEMQEWINSVYLGDGANNNTPINIMIVGDHVRPHSFEYKNKGDRCFTDKEIRQRGGTYKSVYIPPLGDSDPRLGTPWKDLFKNMYKPDSIGFAYPNFYARNIAERTRGAWMPIRSNSSWHYCRQYPSGLPHVMQPRYTDGTKGISCGDGNYHGYLHNRGQGDSDSFLGNNLYRHINFNPDPQCRSKANQTKDFMKEVITGNPYKIAFAN